MGAKTVRAKTVRAKTVRAKTMRGKTQGDLKNMLQAPDGGVFLAGELLKIRTRAGLTEALHANVAQRAFEARRGRLNIVLKARQMGMSTWIAGQFLLRTLARPGVLSVQVAHTREAAEGLFATVQRMWDELPEQMREGRAERTRSTSGRMVFGALDSEFRVVSAGEENAGRGLTIQNLHCSEVSRWPGDAQATLAGLRAALVPDGEMTLESTPWGAYGAFYEEWQRAAETGAGKAGMVRHFFPWWMEPAYAGEPVAELSEEEAALVAAHGLTAAQIGFRRGLARSFGTLRGQEFAEDAESCFLASGSCCFEVELIDARLAEIPAPVEVRRGGALQVWLPPLPGTEYVVAVDTAGGGSEGDYAAVQVLAKETGLQCAELQQRLPPLELARVAAALAREYGGALLAVERNNHGAAVLAYLQTVERYTRVYEEEGVAGFLTTAGNKPEMVSRLGALLAESPGLFASARLLRECRSFVRFSNGATGAAPGAHDDCLMAMAVGQAVVMQGAGRSSKL